MDIFIPKYKELYIKDGTIKTPKTGMAGEFRCILYRSDGSIKQITPWQKNLITNTGLYNMVRGGWASYLHLGTGAGVPANTDTKLFAWLAVHSGVTIPYLQVTNSMAPDYIYTVSVEYSFNSGVGTGTITEIGASPQNGTNADISTHAMLDAPIVKGASDYLTVQYRYIMYRRTTDVTGTINISGTDYNYTVRGANFDYLHGNSGSAMIPNFLLPGAYLSWKWGSGSLGTIESYPSSPEGSPDFQPSISYGNDGRNYSQAYMQAGVDSYNNKWFKSMWVVLPWQSDPYGSIWTNAGWQMEIFNTLDNTGIYKENTHVLTLNFRSYADRYVP